VVNLAEFPRPNIPLFIEIVKGARWISSHLQYFFQIKKRQMSVIFLFLKKQKDKVVNIMSSTFARHIASQISTYRFYRVVWFKASTHSTPRKFKIGEKALLVFCHRLCQRNLKMRQTPVILDLCHEENSGIEFMVFEKILFKMFSVHTNTQNRRFQIPAV